MLQYSITNFNNISNILEKDYQSFIDKIKFGELTDSALEFYTIDHQFIKDHHEENKELAKSKCSVQTQFYLLQNSNQFISSDILYLLADNREATERVLYSIVNMDLSDKNMEPREIAWLYEKVFNNPNSNLETCFIILNYLVLHTFHYTISINVFDHRYFYNFIEFLLDNLSSKNDNQAEFIISKINNYIFSNKKEEFYCKSIYNLTDFYSLGLSEDNIESLNLHISNCEKCQFSIIKLIKNDPSNVPVVILENIIYLLNKINEQEALELYEIIPMYLKQVLRVPKNLNNKKNNENKINIDWTNNEEMKSLFN